MGGLITLPIRVTARAASLALRGTEATVREAFKIVDGLTSRGPSAARTPEPDAPTPEPEAPTRQPRKRADPRRATAAPPAGDAQSTAAAGEVGATPVREQPAADPYAPTSPEPAHVSEEPELVEEFAEPGAADGAGAEVTIEEPWEGYSQMHADEVIDRLGAASAGELAAIELYERAHRDRDGVLEAAERQLRLAARPGGSG
jgi:hypothetical protein